MEDLVAWMALAWRSALGAAEQGRIALGPGPRAEDYERGVLDREAEDLRLLEDLGVRLLPITDPEYPQRLREREGPVLLQVAGRVALLEEEGVAIVAGHKPLGPLLDSGDRAVAVLSKGLLSAKTLLRALHEPLADGQVALVSAEPPRATWGPVRDGRRDRLCAQLTR